MRVGPDDTSVVTGGASGIGLALVRALLARGLRVAVADVEVERLATVADRLAALHGGRVLAVRTDVSSRTDVEALRDEVLDRFGRVDLLVNNAGVTGAGGPVWELDERDWQWTLGVNLWGVVHGVRAFVPGMVAAQRGHVLNVASLSGLTAPPYTAPYNATKHAVVALSETLAGELAMSGSGVGVSVACPGLVDTAIWEAERNRPAHLRHDAGDNPTYDRFFPVFRTMLGAPSDADATAAQMLAGVERDQLHVLTHPHMHEHVLQRLDTVRQAAAVAAP